MTLRFVKTSVLTSDDGIDFSNETSLETDEARKARQEADSSSNKPLFQQLADLRDRKQLEYDENTRKIFAPPKGLDEDDLQFFQDLEDSDNRAKQERVKHEELELQAFRQAQRTESPNESTSPIFKLNVTKRASKSSTAGPQLKLKRKLAEGLSVTQPATTTKHRKTKEGEPIQSTSPKAVKDSIVTSTIATNSTMSMLASYDSDSDS